MTARDRAMSQENVDKARDFIPAYNRRDFDAAVESFDPEIEWVLPERQSSDSCRGMPATAWRPGLRHYGRGKRSAAEIDEEMYHQVATFRGGRMVRIEYFGNWSEALEAAGLSPQDARRTLPVVDPSRPVPAGSGGPSRREADRVLSEPNPAVPRDSAL
jgi:hypothetical protein